jgi:hypothetical protein
VKRGGPLRRKTALKRGAPLRPDPEKVREWRQRSAERARSKPRASIKRGPSQLKRTSKRRPPPRGVKEGPLTPTEWKKAVFERTGFFCHVSGISVSLRYDDAHHCLPARVLRTNGAHDYLWDPRLGIPLSSTVHELHTNRSQVIYRDQIPASVWEVCAELAARDGTEWAAIAVEREHPERPEEVR